jgi:hypothetical protein
MSSTHDSRLEDVFRDIGIKPDDLILYRGEPMLVRTYDEMPEVNEVAVIDITPHGQGFMLSPEELADEYESGRLQPAGVHNAEEEIPVSIGAVATVLQFCEAWLEQQPVEDASPSQDTAESSHSDSSSTTQATFDV